MRVQFYPDDINSDIITVPDDITEQELSDMACEWVSDNVCGFWKVLGGEVQEEDIPMEYFESGGR